MKTLISWNRWCFAFRFSALSDWTIKFGPLEIYNNYCDTDFEVYIRFFQIQITRHYFSVGLPLLYIMW